MLPIFNDILRERRRQRENRIMRVQRRVIRETTNPFVLPERRFIELFRLNKRCARTLCDSLRPHLGIGRYRNKISVETKVLTALRFYATGCYQRSVGEDFILGLSQTMVHRCIHDVSYAINEHIAGMKITFPTERGAMNRNKQAFMEQFQFPGVLGVIDCTHIAILKPVEQEQNYINRKGYHSLNVQVICNVDLKILNIYANFPGSTHDAFIWNQSNVRTFLLRQYNNGLRGTWLIGDSGYPLEPFLLVPFLHPDEGSPEARFNDSFGSARNCIERCIGLLKMRFRCLMRQRTARYSPEIMGAVINSCAALHNICIEENIPLFERNQGDILNLNVAIPPDHFRNNLLRDGQRVRQTIIDNYFA